MTAVAVCLTATVLVLAGIARADSSDVIDRIRALEIDGRVGVAVEQLRSILTDESHAPDAALLLELARLTDDAGEAVALADDALASTRDANLRARARVLRGDYLYAAGHYDQAAAEYAAATELGAPAHVMLRHAAALLAMGDIAGAIRVYDGAASGSDVEAAAWASIGRERARLMGGDAAGAAQELERIADQQVGHAWRAHALAAAAEARIAEGRLGRARDLLQLLSSEFPDSFESTLARDRIRTIDQRMSALDELTAEATSAGTSPSAQDTPEEHSE